MKKKLLFGALVLLSACSSPQPEWKLVWEEEFDQTEINPDVWSKIPRGKSDWNKFMSPDDRCYDIKDGNLVLRGIVNDDLKKDSVPYLTGGIFTRGKRQFYGGKLEIRAKLDAGKSVWPAIWLMPENNKEPWPHCGEIDIMERLNHDSIAYQTVHSHYSFDLKINDPKHSSTAPINVDDYNTYGVEIYKDSIVFYVNGIHNFTYPKIETDKPGQFPFDKPWYLMLDMQIGGGWVGPASAEDLPVEMKVDWVRYYQKNE